MRGYSVDFKSVMTPPAKDTVIGNNPPPTDVKTVEEKLIPQIEQISGLVRAKDGPRADAGEIRSEEGYYWIRVDQTVPYPGQPRKSFPKDEMEVFINGIR